MWVCGKCQSEVEDTFFECWSCGAAAPEVDSRAEWFEPLDSLVLAIPRSLLPAWPGSGPSAPGVPSQELERVFAVKGWLGTVGVGTGQALVLGEQPTVAAFFKTDGALCILRWLCAGSSRELLELVESEAPESEAGAAVLFAHPGGSLCLISAGDPGQELAYQPPAAELPAGCYSVTTHVTKKHRTQVLIHRFEYVP
jgi:hypothetical protein